MLKKIVKNKSFFQLKKKNLYISIMKEGKEIGLNFIIDKLTNSIENVITGDSFATEISLLKSSDLKNISKNKKWLFDWNYEFK